MNKTKIEWVKNPPWKWTDDSGTIHLEGGGQGYTWNPITGCLNGCEYCYARRLAHGRLKQRYLANQEGIAELAYLSQVHRRVALNDPFYPRFWPERLYQKDSPRLWETKQKPKGIFVCDMSDLFGIGIPEAWTSDILDYIKRCPSDRFYLLTKQSQNLAKFSPFPDNCWVGVTATNQAMLGDALYWLRRIEATIKYISVEPHLDRIVPNILAMREAKLGWIIDGAQTKPYKPPKIEWVQEIVEAADKAGIPVFLKDKLESLLPHTKPFYREVSFGGRFLIYRQEMP